MLSATARIASRSSMCGAQVPCLQAATATCAGSVQSAGVFGVRWSTKKSGGSSSNGRDSQSKRLGVKKFGGEYVEKGNIILRQRGTRMHPAENVGMGRDHTLFALAQGTVQFTWNRMKKRQFVSVKPWEEGATLPKRVVRKRNQPLVRRRSYAGEGKSKGSLYTNPVPQVARPPASAPS